MQSSFRNADEIFNIGSLKDRVIIFTVRGAFIWLKAFIGSFDRLALVITQVDIVPYPVSDLHTIVF